MTPQGVPTHRVRGRLVGAAVAVERLELAVHRPGEPVVCLPVMELAAEEPLRGGSAFEACFLVPRSWVSSRFRYEVVARPAPAPPRPRRRRARALALSMLACGLVLAADGVATIVWKDPVTSLYTAQAQAGLRHRLADRATRFTEVRSVHREVRTVYPPAPAAAAAATGGPAAAFRRAARYASLYGRSAATGDPLGTIRIPRIGLKMVFVEGTGAAQLREGPAHYAGTALPGQPGTVALAGHRTTYLAPFRDLDQLRRGDPIVLETPYGRFTYAVQGHAVVQPTSVGVLDQSWAQQWLVLTSCHPIRSAAERIVVVARLRSEQVI